MAARRRFLQTALRCLEENDGTELHNLAIDLDADWFLSKPDTVTEDDNRVFNELCGELTRNTGERLAAERTRLGPAPCIDPTEIISRHGSRLSPEARRLFAASIAALGRTRDPAKPQSNRKTSDEQADALESHYATEVLGKLDTIVSRALRLEHLPLSTAPNSSVKRYFRKAHDAYLYGFDTACVALCRAIVEAALKDVVLLKDRAHESVVGVIHLAKHRGLLNAERAAWAEEVYGAGNLAIHKHEAFQKKYPAERVRGPAQGPGT